VVDSPDTSSSGSDSDHDPGGPPPPGVDVSVPHPARVRNFWLGGRDYFTADRAAGLQLAREYPHLPWMARTERAFLVRATRFLAGPAKIRQFLDIGSGLPAGGNTHEVAQRIVPDTGIVYVDNDPVVLAHAKALLDRAESGYDRSGYDGSGYDGSGYDGSGYDGSGYDGSGYDGSGYDGSGYGGAGAGGAGAGAGSGGAGGAGFGSAALGGAGAVLGEAAVSRGHVNGPGPVSYIDADLRDIAAVLNGAASTLDFRRPVALIMLGILGHIADYGVARSIVSQLLAAIPAGSYLAIADGVSTDDAINRAQLRFNSRTDAIYDSHNDAYSLRRPDEFASFFDGLDLVEPGVVACAKWKPDRESADDHRVPMHCGIARTLTDPSRNKQPRYAQITQRITARTHDQRMSSTRLTP
jgi:hypothetical protein